MKIRRALGVGVYAFTAHLQDGRPDFRPSVGPGMIGPGIMLGPGMTGMSHDEATMAQLQVIHTTTKSRRRFIERFRIQHGDKRVSLLRRNHIEKMLAAIEKPTAKRGWFKAIRPLLQSAVPSLRKDDPTAGIAGIKLPKTKGHHAWTDDEIERYLLLAARRATAARHGICARKSIASW